MTRMFASANPLQAGFAEGVIQKLQAGEAVDAWTLVVDEAFVAPGITSSYAITMSQEYYYPCRHLLSRAHKSARGEK